MKKIFNWLAQRSAPQPTLGYAALRPFAGRQPADNSVYNIFRFRNGGRAVERAVFLGGCFAAAAALPLTAPLALSTVFLGAAAAVAAKTVGVLAGKAADLVIEDINMRVIPRREEQKPPQP